MGKEKSDNLMLVLAVVAVLVSVVGFLSAFGVFGLSKGITGYQTQSASGNVNVTILGTLSIRLVPPNISINFGNGTVIPSAGTGFALLESNSTDGFVYTAGAGSGGTFNRSNPGITGSDGRKAGGLWLENNGNTNVTSLTVSTQSETPNSYICLNNGQCITDGPQFSLSSRSISGTACNFAVPGTFNNQVWVPATGSPQQICTAFASQVSPNNKIEVNVRLRIPETAPTGTRNANLLFQAS